MSRVVPVNGTDAERQANAAKILNAELHSTTDQQRLWLKDKQVAPVYHVAADTAARLGLASSTRGCWPADVCLQTNTGAIYLCIGNNGSAAADWTLLWPGQQTTVPAVDESSMPGNGDLGTLTFSATPTAAECEALRDECEDLRDALAATITTVNALRSRLIAAGLLPA